MAKVDKKADVDYIVRKYYKMIGFKGKPYRMRNFGSRALKLIETRHNDHKLKEYLCGHKVATMSFIYDNRTKRRQRKRLEN